MSIGRSITNKRAAYGRAENDIAMPPLDEQPTIASVPNPWENQPQQQEDSFIQVPDELPKDVIEEMKDQDSGETTSEPEQEVEQEVARTPQQDRFKNIREAKERAERERDALMAQIIQMQQQGTFKKQEVVQKVEEVEDDFNFNIDDETLLEGKHAKLFLQELKKVKKEMRQYKNQSEGTALESRIQANFPDFNEVVSRENVEILNSEYPEIAESLRDTSNMYNKAASAYSVIKRFGIGEKKQDAFVGDKAKAVSNAQKPRPLASVSPQQGDSPLSKANAFANGLTEEMKVQLRKEMYSSRQRNN